MVILTGPRGRGQWEGVGGALFSVGRAHTGVGVWIRVGGAVDYVINKGSLKVNREYRIGGGEGRRGQGLSPTWPVLCESM